MNVLDSQFPLGAEVQGLDLRQPLSGQEVGGLRRVIHERGVVVVRGQQLKPNQQVDVGRYFGEPEVHLLGQYLLPGFPELLVVSNVIENGKQIGIIDAGSTWHTDMAYMKNPTYLSMLYAIEVPHDNGSPLGDTQFVSTSFAYETLPDDVKQNLEGRMATHSYASRSKARHEGGSRREAPSKEQLERAADVRHPVFRKHPFCDKTCIYVNKAYTTEIVGMEAAQSKAQLNDLFSHLIRPDFVYRHKWSVGDLVIWDNTQTQHLATFDYAPEQRRRMHRVSLRGTAPY